MKKLLFLGNTPYQILLSAWIKYHYYPNDTADIIINDRLKNFEKIKENIENISLFDKVIILPNQYRKNKVGKASRIIREYVYANSAFKNANYDEFFFANFDFFIQRLYDRLKRTNPLVKANYYEDGILSYSKKNEYFYQIYRKPNMRSIDHNNIFVKEYLYGSLDKYMLFTPELLEWDPLAKSIVKIDCIDRADNCFKKAVNKIFGYEKLEDTYSQKYIFFEESYFQDTGYMEDVQLIDALADEVGKENLMIKIHPRNQVNRFRERGYQTNTNTVVPWEVLALNLDLDNKVLLTIASSSIVNPAAMFGCKAKAYSLMNCLANKPYQLNNDYSKTVLSFFNHFDNVQLCNDLKEIVER